MSFENIHHIMQMLRRHLDSEIERIENEIARLSAIRKTSSSSVTGSSPPRNEISRNFAVPEDSCSVESFQTADDSSRPSSRCGASVLPSVVVSPAVAMFPPLEMPFPPFSPQNIEMWFWAMEKWFAGTNVRDDEHRFAAILLALPMPTITIFKSQLDNPPFCRKYEFAKSLIVRHFSRNEFDRIKSLIDAVELGDAKPSELYANMSQIAGEVVSPATLKGLWIMRLPELWRSSLALTSDEPLEFLRAADLMFEVTPKSSILAASDNARAMHCNIVSKGTVAKNDIRTASQPHSEIEGPCYFHAKFGIKARKCRVPCSWKKKEAASEK